MVDIDALEQLLVDAARDRRTVTYSEVLGHFGKRVTPIRVYALCRDLGSVSERNSERREPELAVLVVRKTDRLPGEGFFHGAWKDGSYDGPATGPRARAYIDGLTKIVFNYFSDVGCRTSGPSEGRSSAS
ncbi:MAG: ribose-phosphate pyrophosphokinase [Geminicoccaceae bacterium]